LGFNHADSGSAIIGIGNNLDSITVLPLGAGVSGNGKTTGVYGLSRRTQYGRGVFGIATSDSAYGVLGIEGNLTMPSNITRGTGVLGYSNNIGVYGWGNTTSSTYGVFGLSSDSLNGYGVVGVSKTGVAGQGNSTRAANVGVWASTFDYTGAEDYGLLAQCSNTVSDWAGWFIGDKNVTGSIYKGANYF
jgi:hypothetical protein